CQPTDPINKWYANLKAQASTTPSNNAGKARTKYKQAVYPLTKPAKSWKAWIDNWQEALQTAQTKKVPEAQQPATWYDDFEAAIRGAGWSNWCALYRLVNQKSIDAGTLDYRDLVSAFNHKVRAQEASRKPSRFTKGSFGATYGNQGADRPEQEKAPGSSKRRYTGGSHSGCRVCGNAHNLEGCWYLFPEKAFIKWNPSQERKDRAEEALQADESLRKEVEALRKKHKVVLPPCTRMIS
ncbi:hypothetical protein B0T26DRAFT_796223, partial [Lasiosphaeria miniovina]